MRIVLIRPLQERQEDVPIIVPPNLDYQHTPFPIINDLPVRVLCYHDTLGIIIGSFPDRDRVYIKYIIPRTYCSKIKGLEIYLGGIILYK